VLSGRAAPGGRLLITQYPADYIDQVPMTNQSLQPNSSNPGRTYRWYNNSVIPFGTGLHYTNYSVSWAPGGSGKKTYQISKFTKTSTSPIDLALFDSFRIEVNSVGSATSDYVALLFLKSANAGPSPHPSRH
jgi:beta-D-xylosidase 4